MYRDALGRDTLDPWMLCILILGELHDTYMVMTHRIRKEQMCWKLEKGAHKKQSEQWDVGYKHKYPLARQWVGEGHQEVDHEVWRWGTGEDRV